MGERPQRSRTETAARLTGLGVAGSRAAAVWVERLDDIPGGWRLALGGPALGELVGITVTRVEPGAEYFVRTSELGLRFEGHCASPMLRRLLLYVSRRLARVPYARLQRVLGTEADRVGADSTGKRGGSPGDRTDRSDRSSGGTGTLDRRARGHHDDGPFPGIHQAWNHPRAWMHFFAEEELMPARDVAFSLGDESIRVEHGDFECQFVAARGFVIRPWAHRRDGEGRVRRRRGRPSGRQRRRQRPPGPEPSSRHRDADDRARRLDPRTRSLFTNLRELDAIDGGTERFETLMTAVRRHLRPEVVMVNCTCVPQIVGDDTAQVVAEQRPLCAFPIVYKDQRPEQNPHDRGLGMMREALRAASTTPSEPNVVHLIGFTQGRDRDELCSLLLELGIEVHRMLVPEISPRLAAGFGRASLLVQFPNPDWLPFCDKLLADLDIPRLTVPAPYGLQGTGDFLAAVARGLDREDLLPVIADRAERFAEQSWLPLVSEARRERVGLVCEVGAVERLRGFAVLWGYPLVPLLQEMGFAVSLALVASDPSGPAALKAYEQWRGRDVEVAIVESEAALGRWLERADVSAVYSDFFFDSRLVRTGHPPFSSRIFERGWLGAARALQQLLDRCRLGLIRRDHAWLFCSPER